MEASESYDRGRFPPVRLTPIARTDLEEAHRLSALFKWPHRFEDWLLMLEFGFGIAARDADGRLVGTALWWSYGPSAASAGMILVDPRLQRQGIGRKLMEALVAEAGERRLMLYSTQAGRSLYKSSGFREAGRARQFRGTGAGPIGSARVRPALPADHARIREYDALAFGAPREQLMTALLAIGTTFVIETHGRVSGFAIRRRFGLGDVIGPVVATSEPDALELVAASLGPKYNRIDISYDSASVRAELLRLGMADAGVAISMIRGAWPAQPLGIVHFGLASQAFG